MSDAGPLDSYGAYANTTTEPWFTDWLREELDTVGPTLSARQQERVARLFKRTVELEVDFFEAAYNDL